MTTNLLAKLRRRLFPNRHNLPKLDAGAASSSEPGSAAGQQRDGECRSDSISTYGYWDLTGETPQRRVGHYSPEVVAMEKARVREAMERQRSEAARWYSPLLERIGLAWAYGLALFVMYVLYVNASDLGGLILYGMLFNMYVIFVRWMYAHAPVLLVIHVFHIIDVLLPGGISSAICSALRP